MKVLLQRVSSAAVTVDGQRVSSIGQGYLLFVGVMQGDTQDQAQALVDKILALRLFDGEDGTINDRTIQQVGGEILVVSQFTLAGTTHKGNRPDYTAAAPRAEALALYERFVAMVQEGGGIVQQGVFGAHMQVELVNDGPVTLLLER